MFLRSLHRASRKLPRLSRAPRPVRPFSPILDDFQPRKACSSSSPRQLHASPACSPVPYVASPERHVSTTTRRLGGSRSIFSPEAPPTQYTLHAADTGAPAQAPS